MTVLRMTAEQVQEHQARAANWRQWPNLHGEPEQPSKARAEYVPICERKRGMNGLESAYARHLDGRKAVGQIDWYEFEPMRLKLADGTYYRPDFAVLRNGQLEFHETKGHMREAARVRLNVAADKFPFVFYLVRKDRAGFSVNRVGSVPRGTEDGR